MEVVPRPGKRGLAYHAVGGGSIATARKELHYRMGAPRKALLGSVKSQSLKVLSTFGDIFPPNRTNGSKTALGITLEG